MTVESKNQLFRLAAVLYADNNYEVAPKTIIRKVIESALLSNGNKAINIHSLIDFVHESYNLHLVEEEVKSRGSAKLHYKGAYRSSGKKKVSIRGLILE